MRRLADRSEDRESGSATYIVIMWAVVMWLLLSVVVDVGLAISERERAADLANAAARAEAQNLDPTQLRQGKNVLINDPNCLLAKGYITSSQVRASTGTRRRWTRRSARTAASSSAATPSRWPSASRTPS